jgi:hypothetical protein
MDALRGRARAATREPATRAPAVIAELGGFTRPRLVFSRQRKSASSRGALLMNIEINIAYREMGISLKPQTIAVKKTNARRK